MAHSHSRNIKIAFVLFLSILMLCILILDLSFFNEVNNVDTLEQEEDSESNVGSVEKPFAIYNKQQLASTNDQQGGYEIDNLSVYNKYPEMRKHRTKERDIKTETVTAMFLEVLHILNFNEDITYWCMFGTLLGLKRDSYLMPWDYDADFAILKSDAKKIFAHKKFIRDLAEKGLVMKKSKNCAIKIFKIEDTVIFCPNSKKDDYCYFPKPHIDLFTYTKSNSKNGKDVSYQRSRSCSWSPNLSKKATDSYYINSELIFPLKETSLSNYDNVRTFFPKETDKMLELIYGKKWRTPIYTDRKNDQPKKIKHEAPP